MFFNPIHLYLILLQYVQNILIPKWNIERIGSLLGEGVISQSYHRAWDLYLKEELILTYPTAFPFMFRAMI